MAEHKLIIAGSRGFNDIELMATALDGYRRALGDTEVAIVSGMARGADTLAVSLAETKGLKVYKFPADWGKHGKRAGPLRNTEMAEFADSALIFWDGESRGAQHMLKTMNWLRKPFRVYCYNETPTRIFGANLKW